MGLKSWYQTVRERTDLRLMGAAAVLAAGTWAFFEISQVVGMDAPHALDERLLMLFREPGDLDDPIGGVAIEEAVRDLTALGIRTEDFDAIGFEPSEGYAAREFDVELVRFAREQVAAQVDGEEWHAGHRFRVNVRPRALPLITPADFVPSWRS